VKSYHFPSPSVVAQKGIALGLVMCFISSDTKMYATEKVCNKILAKIAYLIYLNVNANVCLNNLHQTIADLKNKLVNSVLKIMPCGCI
jgi:hypothetical protein